MQFKKDANRKYPEATKIHSNRAHPKSPFFFQNLAQRAPFFCFAFLLSLGLVFLEILRHVSLEYEQELHPPYLPPIAISRNSEEQSDSGLIRFTTAGDELPQYERVTHNDAIWEQISNLYYPKNCVECAVDCSFLANGDTTCRCFETLSDLYRRTLRMLPKSGILTIDMDIVPNTFENSMNFPERNIVDPPKSPQEISLPFLPLYTASMGHRSILFTNSQIRARAISSIAKSHNLEDHIEVLSSADGYLNLNSLTQDWALLMRVSANGDETRVIQGASDFIANRTVTYMALRFWPEGIRGHNEKPEKLLKMLLDWDFKISLLALGGRIVKNGNHSDPWNANDMITYQNADEFVTSLNSTFSYLYVTRGADVAIPDHMTYRRFDKKAGNTVYSSCDSDDSRAVSVTLQNGTLTVLCSGKNQPVSANFVTSFEDAEITFREYTKPVKIESEFVCANVQCSAGGPMVEKCAVRNIPKQARLEKFARQLAENNKDKKDEEKGPKADENKAAKKNWKKSAIATGKNQFETPNILVLLIDALSRKNFLHFFPQTVKRLNTFMPEESGTLSEFTFLNFTNYHVVGTNSGPNQAAAFAGELVGGGDTSLKKKTADQEWVWKILKERHDYTTLKIEDMCYKHSGMLKTLGYADKNADPPTTHAFLEFFCAPNYRRPHCIGDKPVSNYMFQYLQSFISNYQNRTPWAAFANFGEAHEDSVSLAGIADSDMAVFFDFIASLDNTVTVLMSDHGLHYGPYFQTRTGQEQHMSPFLFMLMHENVLKRFSDVDFQALLLNQHAPTTPLNLYHTLRDLIDGNVSQPTLEARSSFLRPIRKDIECSEMGVPAKYCRRTVLNPPPVVAPKCRVARHYPSASAFVMDQNEPYHAKTDTCTGSLAAADQTVWHPAPESDQSAGSLLWMNCSSSLENGIFWTRPKQQPRNFLREYDAGSVQVERDAELLYSMCINPLFPEKSQTQLQVRHVPKAKAALQQRQRLGQEYTQNDKVESSTALRPNIFMFNIDSASRAESLRGLKHTLSSFSNIPGYSYFDFSLYNTIGYNRIPNQVAALSGCAARDISGKSLFISPPVLPGDVYELLTPANKDYQLLCARNQLPAPQSKEEIWLFDLLKNRGYMTLWARDSCESGYPLKKFFPKKSKLVDHEFGDFNCENRLGFFQKNSFCVAHQYAHSHTLNYLRQYHQNYLHYPHFAVVDLMASKKSTEYGNTGSTRALDKDLATTISDLTNNTNSLIVLFSYHGINSGFAIDSNAGQLEHKLPALHVLVPNSILEKFDAKEKFAENSQRLVTPFDIYATVRHLVDQSHSSAVDSLSTERFSEIPNWAYSFFQKIPENRNCQEAQIPENYCACDYSEQFWPCSYPTNAPGCQLKSQSAVVVPHV